MYAIAEFAKKKMRRRTNSELILIADTWGSPGEGIYNEETASSADSDSSSSSGEAVGMARSPFRLLQCSDEQCEVFTPMNRSIRTQHRARNNVQFMWDEPPKSVLIIKKPNDTDVTQTLIRFSHWLMKEKKLAVYIEPVVHEELRIPNAKTWDSEDDWEECQTNIDFVIALGGDGTVLWVSSMFKKSVPPVISFAMGSLGFLTPFEIGSYAGAFCALLELLLVVRLLLGGLTHTGGAVAMCRALDERDQRRVLHVAALSARRDDPPEEQVG